MFDSQIEAQPTPEIFSEGFGSAPPITDYFQLEDGSGFFRLEDGAGNFQLE